MGCIKDRDLLAHPQGNNSSDTIIGGLNFNLTTLSHWNYTYYSNQTLSNGSHCYLVFKPYTPVLLQNGTFLNSTSCYSPVEPMRGRAKIGIGFGIFFAMSIMFTFINLRKHGKRYLPAEKRFRVVGRRWQWYWMLAVAGFALVSSITNVDVDRYYLPELPMILSNFFWVLMLPCTLAVVWESVRHWGSWQERQMVETKSFSLRQNERRSKVEFWLPLLFYFFVWMNFFMVVPRSWTKISKQRDLSQARVIAEPVVTDIRFKLAAFLNFGAWCTIVFSLQNSLKHYKPRNRGLFNRIVGLITYTPTKFILTILLALILVGYEAACSFDFTLSPLKYHDTNLGMMYGLGWGPIALMLLIQEIAGYVDPNEDRELIRQRRVRGAEIDREIGITKKPHWWSKLHGDNTQRSVPDQVAQNVGEIGGKATDQNLEASIEMGSMHVSKKREVSKLAGNIETVRKAASSILLLSNQGHDTQAMSDRSERIHDTGSEVAFSADPQQITSMLDV